MSGAPLNNQNAAKGRMWNAAIQKALRKRSKSEQMEALQEIADKLLDRAMDGDITALKELGDRLDGKSHQTIGGDGPDGEIPVSMTVKYVRPNG